MNWFPISAIAFLAMLPAFASAPAGYVDPAVCAGCHTQVAKHYRQTAMAKSFFRPRQENTIEDYEKNNVFYHAASDRYYQTYRKAGKYYQLRYQIGLDGKKTKEYQKDSEYVHLERNLSVRASGLWAANKRQAQHLLKRKDIFPA